jgi:hypothetical protein
LKFLKQQEDYQQSFKMAGFLDLKPVGPGISLRVGALKYFFLDITINL